MRARRTSPAASAKLRSDDDETQLLDSSTQASEPTAPKDGDAPTFHRTRSVIVRFTCLVYVVAFGVAAQQNTALIGEHGLLSAKSYLKRVKEHFGAPECYERVPTLLWLVPGSPDTLSDSHLQALAVLGVVLAGIPLCRGSANMVQQALGIAGEEILYVGDHIYTDAALAKLSFRWRTCLIVRELESEVEAFASGRSHRQYLKSLLDKKERIGDAFNSMRLTRQRLLCGRDLEPKTYNRVQEMNDALAELLGIMEYLDTLIGPAISEDGADFNCRWGYLSRAGVNDRSQLLKQIEKYADIYTSRVSNLLRYTPFVYFRSPAQSMAHDRPKNDDLVIQMNSDDE